MGGWGRKGVGVVPAGLLLSVLMIGAQSAAALQSDGSATITLRRVSGKVFVRAPDATTFESFSGSRGVLVGTEVEASNGRVALVASSRQHAEFFQGRFVIETTTGVVDLRLTGSSFKNCKNARKLAGSDKHGPPRQLWGTGKGKFRTKGRYSVTSVRGTTWYTADSCSGTIARVTRGSVDVADLLRNRNLHVARGHGYVAKAPREFSVPMDSADPGSITAGPDGNLWFTEGIGNIARSTPRGNVIEFPVPASETNDEGTSSPETIVAGPDRNLWLTDRSSHTVDRVTTTGRVTLFEVSGAPHGLTVGPDHNLWFTEDNSRIGRLTTGGVLTEFVLPFELNDAAGIAAGPDGRLWFTEPSADKIARMTLNGDVTEFDIPTADATPSGLVRGPDGNLWFTETTAGKVGKITPEGNVSDFALPDSDDAGPDDITAGADKNLWLVDPVLSRIVRVGLNGHAVAIPTPTDSSTPTWITSGPGGAIWFTEMDANAIGCARC
jgi:streptogramin lyase